MRPLKKFAKKELIQLVKQYEQDISNLTDDLENLSLTHDRIEYVYMNSDDDKAIQYLKGRLKCVKGLKKLPYIAEYDRLTKTT